MQYIFLILGFVFLVKGADIFVSGAGSIAKKFKISDLIIGLTVVAFGTSAPELSVSVISAINGQSSIAISNVVGSNLFNGLVVLGICAIMSPINVKTSVLKKEIPIALLSAVLLFLLLSDGFIFGASTNGLSRIDGIILLIGFLFFMIFILKSAKSNPLEIEDSEIKDLSMGKSLLMVIVGLAAVVYGGDLVVKSATAIAVFFGISEIVIGLTIVAVGTSLPELVTSIIACRKGSADMALGNVIGSNVFNILMILGATAVIKPMSVDMQSVTDTFIVVIVTALIFLVAFTKNKITKTEGIMLVLCYVAYTMYIFLR